MYLQKVNVKSPKSHFLKFSKFIIQDKKNVTPATFFCQKI